MKKLSVIKQGAVVQHCHFDNEQVMQEFVDMLAATGAWGLPERPELNEMGEPTGVVLPAEYTLEIKDITAEIEAEKQAKEVKKLAKEKRKDDRKKLDWNKINTVAELKAIVKSLVEEQED